MGVLQPWSSDTNKTSYWEKQYASHGAKCYSYDADDSTAHGKVTDSGKTVTLKPFSSSWTPYDHWELLVIKGGSLWNNVIEHPKAGVAYASPSNGNNQADVSHWIVCKGKTPEGEQPKPPKQDLDCTSIIVDYNRALKSGDHINIEYKKDGKTKQVNAYVDLNVTGGWNGLGLRFSDGSTKPLTEAEVKSGVIDWTYSALIPTGKYTVKFVQTNETDTWPDLKCENEEEPTVVTPSLQITLPTCTTPGSFTKSDNVTWTSASNSDGSTTWTAAPKPGTVFAEGAKTVWEVPNLAKLPLDSDACRPDKPEPKVTSVPEDRKDCTSKFVTTTTTTTTTEYVWNGQAWVLGTPVVSTSSEERPMTAAELKECPLPTTGEEKTPWVDGAWDCGDTTVTQTREVTTTTYAYGEQGDVIPTVTKTAETQTRELESDEIGEVCDLVPGEIEATCVGDVPFLGYDVALPEGFETDDENPVTITFVNTTGGEDFVAENQPLSGVLLWPGASNLAPKMWPGWELVNGEYVKTDGNYDWTRKGVTVRFEVNPSYSTEVFYPEASAECANPPVGGGDDPTGTPASTDPEALAVTGGGISPMFAVAGGAVLLAGIAAVAFAAYRRRHASAE
ncbi:hypothetical protein ACLBXX_18965 [Microbacterium sp. C23T]